jgi:hypothetical protein
MVIALAFIVGIGVMALIMLITSMIIDGETHVFLKLINILFPIALMLMIPYVVSETKQNCDILLTNSTTTATVLGAVTTSTVSNTFGEQCFTNTLNSPDTLIIVSNAYLWTVGGYWGIQLLIILYNIAINMIATRGANITLNPLKWWRKE